MTEFQQNVLTVLAALAAVVIALPWASFYCDYVYRKLREREWK